MTFSPCDNRSRQYPEKCSVRPVGYVLLGIYLRGPKFRETVAANLAAFASVSARRKQRPSQSE
jgi:hypothetical protein